MIERATPLAALLLVVLSSGCSPHEGTPARAELQEIPAPSLSGAEEAVRQQIEAQQKELEAAKTDADPAALSQLYGDLGLLYLTYSFLEAAEVCFSNAAALSGGDYRWPYLEGYLFQIQGRLDEASEVLETALELRPDNAPALIRLGTVRLELGADAGARPLFERVLSRDPGSAAALDGLAKIAAAQGDAKQAIEKFEKVLELQPTASSAHHALGLAYRKVGNLERAEFHLAQGGDAPVLFADPLLSKVAEIGRSAELYLVRAAQAFAEGRFAQAEAYYRKALEIDATDFTARKALGFCLEKLGDIEGAVAQLQEAMETGTTGEEEKDVIERSELLRVLGGLRILQGQEREGIEAFRQALELDPERLDTRRKLGNALARLGRLDEALGHFDQVLAARPDLADVLISRATALINVGRPRDAIADFEQAVTSAPEDPEVRLRFAEALDHLGRQAEASEQRRQASDLAATDPKQQAVLRIDEAGRRLSRGDHEGARQQYQEVLRLDPANTDARYQLATILGHLERFDEARAELEQVIASAPHHGPARRAEVTVLLLQGRYGEARGRLQKGLEAMPRDRELAHALARLLAGAPTSSVRDGELALRIATRVHQEAQRSDTAETLAMAFAESGRFAEALELQQQLVQAAERAGGGRQARRWREQLASYEKALPWRAESPDSVIVVLAAGAGAAGAPGR